MKERTEAELNYITKRMTEAFSLGYDHETRGLAHVMPINNDLRDAYNLGVSLAYRQKDIKKCCI